MAKRTTTATKSTERGSARSTTGRTVSAKAAPAAKAAPKKAPKKAASGATSATMTKRVARSTVDKKRPRTTGTHSAGQPSAQTDAPPVVLSAEQRAVRTVLADRRAELQAEYDRAMSDLQDLQADRSAESAGDDQADTGTQTFEREQELALANGILERIAQVDHAVSRLLAGTYGQCEHCGNEIPPARLEAFPAVTLCVTCKQRQERR